jgi:hypothetical protein
VLGLVAVAVDGGGEGGGEGGGSAEWLPIFHRVEAMASKSQAQTEVLAADCARLQSFDRVQRESWELARRLQRTVDELQAAAREKDAEMDRLRAESADARKKLQVIRPRPSCIPPLPLWVFDASWCCCGRKAGATRKMRWEAAYVELLLGANQKLAGAEPSSLGANPLLRIFQLIAVSSCCY